MELNRFSRMIRVFFTLLGILLFVLCSSASARVVYVFNSPLDITRYYTTQIVGEQNNARFELIEFDSNQVLLSHRILLNPPLDISCLDNTLSNPNTGFAYKYTITGQTLESCSISPTAVASTYIDASELALEASVMISKIHSDILPDHQLLGHILFDRVFQLTSLKKFRVLLPGIANQLQENINS